MVLEARQCAFCMCMSWEAQKRRHENNENNTMTEIHIDNRDRL